METTLKAENEILTKLCLNLTARLTLKEPTNEFGISLEKRQRWLAEYVLKELQGRKKEIEQVAQDTLNQLEIVTPKNQEEVNNLKNRETYLLLKEDGVFKLVRMRTN